MDAMEKSDPFAKLSVDERREAEEAIREYLQLVRRLYVYVASHDQNTLTELRRRARLRKNAEKALK